MTITEKYIDIIHPYLEYEEDGGIGLVEQNGMLCLTFQCPFCTHQIRGVKERKKHTAKLIPQRDGFNVYFHCKRGGSPECRGGYRSFLNFLRMFNPELAVKYQKEFNN